MNLLINEQQKLYDHTKIFYICKKQVEDVHAKDKSYSIDKEQCYYTGEYIDSAHNIL